MEECSLSTNAMNLSFSKCHYMHQGNLSLLGQTQTSRPPFYLYPQYLQLIRLKENRDAIIFGHLESENSHAKENISIMLNYSKRIRPENLDSSSKFGMIFVTEAYNESILLQDNTDVGFWINGSLTVIFIRHRKRQVSTATMSLNPQIFISQK